ncbi:MAG: acetoacetate decarboxylase family protein [Parvibaculaceae bacterium]
MTYEFLANRMYRMPTHFGPTLGPRQGPKGGRYDWSLHEFDALSLYFRSERSALEALLPPDFELHEDPVVTISFAYLRNLPWLAGRGYNTLGVRIPARYVGVHETAIGSLSLVLWENMADPIITGREELGVAKIYCDIPPPRATPGKLQCEASWCGFRFIELTMEGLHDVDPARERLDPGPDTDGNLLHFKYFPRTGEWGKADVAYATLTPPVADGTVATARKGTGTLTFHRPRWEDMPTQYRIVNMLADLPRLDVLGVSEITIRGGNFDLYAQRALS